MHVLKLIVKWSDILECEWKLKIMYSSIYFCYLKNNIIVNSHMWRVAIRQIKPSFIYLLSRSSWNINLMRWFERRSTLVSCGIFERSGYRDGYQRSYLSQTMCSESSSKAISFYLPYSSGLQMMSNCTRQMCMGVQYMNQVIDIMWTRDAIWRHRSDRH